MDNSIYSNDAAEVKPLTMEMLEKLTQELEKLGPCPPTHTWAPYYFVRPVPPIAYNPLQLQKQAAIWGAIDPLIERPRAALTALSYAPAPKRPMQGQFVAKYKSGKPIHPKDISRFSVYLPDYTSLSKLKCVWIRMESA
jgi:hypothetical protein